jgi:hypothetical protein
MNLKLWSHRGIILQSGITEKSKRGKASLVPEAWASCRRAQEKGSFVSVNSASGETVPKGMQARYDEIVGIINAFCAEHEPCRLWARQASEAAFLVSHVWYDLSILCLAI